MSSRLHRSSAVSCCRTSRRSSARTHTFIGGLLPTQNISDLPDLISYEISAYLCPIAEERHLVSMKGADYGEGKSFASVRRGGARWHSVLPHCVRSRSTWCRWN